MSPTPFRNKELELTNASRWDHALVQGFSMNVVAQIGLESCREKMSNVVRKGIGKARCPVPRVCLLSA